jgi:hypothetical protein
MDQHWMVGVLGVGVLVAIIVGIAKLVDLARRRRRERAALRGRVTDALMRDERFAGLTLVAKVRVPFWSGSPATIRLVGVVPSGSTRMAALEAARHAAAAERRDVEVEDHTRIVGDGTRAA